MIPQSRIEFKNWCLRKLGEPVIEINVAVEQVEDRIDEALFMYYERHYNGTDETYILYQITDQDVENGYIQLDPSSIMAVTDTFRPSAGSSSMFSMEYQYQLSELYTFSSVYRFGDLTYYYMMQSHFSLINRFFNPDRRFHYNPATGRLTILGGLRSLARTDKAVVVIKAFKKVFGEGSEQESGESQLVGNIWKEKWVREYATALIKQQWGSNMRKYKNIQLLGGVQMSGEELYQEATEEIEKLEIEIDTTYQLPVSFIVG